MIICLSLIQRANGHLNFATEDTANLLTTPIQNLRTVPVQRDVENRQPVATANSLVPNVQRMQEDGIDGGSPLLTKSRPVHVHVAAPNVDVEVQSMKHGFVVKQPTDVTADVS